MSSRVCFRSRTQSSSVSLSPTRRLEHVCYDTQGEMSPVTINEIRDMFKPVCDASRTGLHIKHLIEDIAYTARKFWLHGMCLRI
ncbi:hypothetical protein MRB53_020831 [Persea americana]|uniref:Uncharacterized protein n=1 Tax=Persea americana TaxID=3435 RepID=A0ACC2L3B8_PERAE|nr:hypothetical protein MRB53_020831 [Persea americana]